jgi:hypothetical protein
MGMSKTMLTRDKLARTKRLEAKTSKGCVVLSKGTETEVVTSTEVKINTVCQYNSPTFGLTRLDCTYHKKYS